MVKTSDCFHYIINLLCNVVKLAGMIGKLYRFLEKIVDCAVQFADWLSNLQIGRLDGTATLELHRTQVKLLILNKSSHYHRCHQCANYYRYLQVSRSKDLFGEILARNSL